MEKIVHVPDGIEISIENFKVKVKGSKGSLERDFFSLLFRDEIKLEKVDNKIKISTESEKKKVKAMIGTMGAHIRNLIKGVTEGYTAKLKIVFLHFPITVKASGSEITISNFLGEKNPRRAKIIGNCKVDIQDDVIAVSGIDKEEVGETAANIEKSTRIKKRDRRVFMDGIFRTE